MLFAKRADVSSGFSRHIYSSFSSNVLSLSKKNLLKAASKTQKMSLKNCCRPVHNTKTMKKIYMTIASFVVNIASTRRTELNQQIILK